MIRKINIRVSAANPQMPLGPFYVFTGSAASFTICDIPLPLGVRKVRGVTVRAKNVDGEVRGFAAVRVGSAWGVTVPVGFFSASGSVGRGIVIEASGSDDNGQDIEPWIIGAGDLHVMLMDGSIEPGETTHEMHWHDVRPAHPAAGDVAPYNGGGVYYFNGTEWIYMGGGGADVLGKLPMRPLPKYLHYLAFDDTYPADAQAFYDSLGGARVIGGCSIVRKGGLVGGNFDYPYDDACTFAIKVSAVKGANADGSDRHASVGAAYLGTRLTENIVSSGVNTPLYRVLPGMTESGINDAGVYAKINVIPRDPTKDPAQSETRNINALAVVRYVLDHFDNAADAAEYIAAHYYIPEGSADSYHWMIADNDGTFIVEDGEVASNEETRLTNVRSVGADPYGNGVIRYDLLGEDGTVAELLESVKFTNAYANGWPWPDEFAGQTDAQGKIPQDATERLKAWANERIAPLLDENRKPAARGNGCWQTVHSAIYDFEKKTMAICVQEDFSKRYVFAVDRANVDLAPIEAQIAALQDGKRDKTDRNAYVEQAGEWEVGESPSGWEPNSDTPQPIWDYDWYGNQCWAWHGHVGESSISLFAHVPEDFVGETVFSDDDISCPAIRTKSLVPSGKLLAADNPQPASGSLAKFASDGKMVAAEKSSTSSDPANADYRDPKDNTCHKTEFGEWVANGVPDGVILKGVPFEYDIEGVHSISWEDEDDDAWVKKGYVGDELSVVLTNIVPYSANYGKSFTATRSAVCTSGKKFVTDDVAAKRSDIFGNDGKPTDTFATDLLGKQVAIQKVQDIIADDVTPATDPSLTKTIATIGGKAIKAPEGGGGDVFHIDDGGIYVMAKIDEEN